MPTTLPGFDFVPVWTLLLAGVVFYYVLFDGFDLGVGILSAFARDAGWRRTMMASITPIWDGNETWLVLGGLGLLAAFPLAFAIVIPAIYFPMLMMLLALAFRGVAFEFRFKRERTRRLWEVGFAGGSAIASVAQGVVLGMFIEGFKVEGRSFAGTSFDWLRPFPIFTGLSLALGYGMLGAGWLVMKTEGELQAWARRVGRMCVLGVALAVVVVSVWTPLHQQRIFERWFSWPNLVFLAPVPIATAGLLFVAWRALGRKSEQLPFFAGIGVFLLSFIGIEVSLWPMIVPYRYSFRDAAAAESTQGFLLVGTLVLVPLILVYTAWSYWVFRGKVRAPLYH